MPTLFGKKFSKQELLDRVGDISQIGGVRQVRLAGGAAEGVEAVEFRTGSGFNFLAVPGRGLDITVAEHNGRSLAWRSSVGEANAAFYESMGQGWLRNFAGGLVATCGLTYAGAPCADVGQQLGLHGRYSNTPASNVCADGEWDGDEYKMWVSGKVREGMLYGDNLLLRRKVSAVLGQNKLWIDDVVTNEGVRRSPHMMLYHINAGYPVVDAGARFVSPTQHVQPRDADAEAGKDRYDVVEPPTPGFEQQVFYHDMACDADGTVYVGIVNANMPAGEVFGFYVKYNKNELPRFVEWKMNGTQEYVVGLEPSNCWVEGRDKDRERGILQFLKPGETREYHLEIGVITDRDELAWFENMVASLKR